MSIPLARLVCPCWITAVRRSLEPFVRVQFPPGIRLIAVISGETMTKRANPAKVRSLGANERRVRFPPLRLRRRAPRCARRARLREPSESTSRSLPRTSCSGEREPIPSTATCRLMPPFQGWDATLRRLLAEVRVLSVVRSALVRKTGRRFVRVCSFLRAVGAWLPDS